MNVAQRHESLHAMHTSAPVHWVPTRVLVLNASHEPLAVVTGRRALILILAGKAVSLEDRSTLMRSAQLAVALPSVVRLTRYVRVPYRPPATISRAGVLRRDARRCAYCTNRADTIDHVIPRSRGGSHSWENCVACCHRCNTRKADRMLEELGWELSFSPGPPARITTGEHFFPEELDPAWRRWLDSSAA